MSILLRTVKEADLETFYLQQREPEGNRLAKFPAREREDFMRHWHQNVLGNQANQTQTITIDGDVAGYIGSWNQNGLRFISYWLGMKFWGQGTATAALKEFITGPEKTRPLHAYVVTTNVSSRRVLEKCGFQSTGEAEASEDGESELLMVLESLPTTERT